MKRYERERMPRRQRGMSMLEVLVSMLVIGLALAMSISMIQTANRYGESAEYSAIALQRAQSIIDRMRANKVAAPAYIFTGGRAGEQYDALYKVDMSKIPNDLKCSHDVNVPATQGCTDYLPVAQKDMTEWREELKMLPGGKGIIRELDYRAGYEVIVMWSYVPESDAAVQANSNKDAHGITVRFSL